MNKLSISTIAFIPLLSIAGCVGPRANHPHHGNMAGIADAQRSALRAPGDSASWCELGDAYASTRQFEKAHSVFAGVVTRGVDAECGEQGIASLGEMGWLVEIERMVLESPSDDELWGDLGDHYSESGETDAALGAYRYAMLLDPDDGEWHNKISEITGESVEELRASASSSMLAMYEAQQGQHQEDDEWLGDYGDLLMSVGREEEACDLYATALALDPDDYEWVGNVAECNGEARPDMDHGMNDDAADESVMDYTTEPTYGEVSLEMGFEPDPHTMDVVAGGDTRVSIAGCYGYVLTSAPDVRLQYTTGESEESYPLSIYVSSQEDTVLFVNQPDGEWICNDDTQGTNPAITLDEPTEGQYDIWVGTYNAESNAMGNLMISEFDEIEWSVNLDK